MAQQPLAGRRAADVPRADDEDPKPGILARVGRHVSSLPHTSWWRSPACLPTPFDVCPGLWHVCC